MTDESNPPESGQGPADEPTAEESREIESIMRIYIADGDPRQAYSLINDQLNTIHTRATAILTVVGAVVTVTGFSGRLIAATLPAAQALVIIGLFMSMAAGAITLVRVMHVRWISTYMYLPPRQWLLVAIRRRDTKTRAIRLAASVLVVGLMLYAIAISLLLVNPHGADILGARLK